MLKLAPFCIGGNSIAVIANFSTRWRRTNTKRQNSYLNQSKHCWAPNFVPLSGQPVRSNGSRRKVNHDGHVKFGFFAEPARRLVDETIFEVVDAHGAQLAFAEVPDFVPVRRTLAGDQVHSVVAVQIDLVRGIAQVLAPLQFSGNVRIAGGGHKSRKPVEPGDDAVLDFAGRHLAWPADPETTPTIKVS